MRNYVQPGDIVPFTAPYDVASGGGALVGSLFVVSTGPVLSGAQGQGGTRGCYDLTKATGAAWTVGAKLYWDNTAKNVTTTSTSNTLIGCALYAAASGDAVGTVRLNGTVS